MSLRLASLAAASAFLIALGSAGCSSSEDADLPDSGAVLACEQPGVATSGVNDDLCVGGNPIDPLSCTITGHGDAGPGAADGGHDHGGEEDEDGCEYGPTRFGNEADDDDCKYHVTWTSADLCEGAGGVAFTVTVTEKLTGKPMTGSPEGLVIEAFQPSDEAAECDSVTTHVSPTTAALVETPAGSGTYVGPIEFDRSGAWTVRFHLHEECSDFASDSPHGHVAFRLSLP